MDGVSAYTWRKVPEIIQLFGLRGSAIKFYSVCDKWYRTSKKLHRKKIFWKSLDQTQNFALFTDFAVDTNLKIRLHKKSVIFTKFEMKIVREFYSLSKWNKLGNFFWVKWSFCKSNHTSFSLYFVEIKMLPRLWCVKLIWSVPMKWEDW